MRSFDILLNFVVTTSEAIRDYHLRASHIRVASRVAE